MSTIFKRFDPVFVPGYGVFMKASADGDLVKAQDAYDRCAALSAEIATLKTQLKDAKQSAK